MESSHFTRTMKYNKKPFFKHTEVFENNNRNYLNENMLQIINIVA